MLFKTAQVKCRWGSG